MSAPFRKRIRCGWLASVLLLCGQSEAARSEFDWVRLARSPGGERTLEHRGSTLRCLFLGSLKWSAQVDLDPKLAAVTDSGRAVLTGFRRQRTPHWPFVDFLVVLVFDGDGVVLQRQELKRTPSGGCSLGGDSRLPSIRGLMLDEASDQAVLRLKATGGHGEWWWIYKLSTGALTRGLHPRERIGERPDWFNLMDARIAPGAGWFVTLWSTGVCTKRDSWRGMRPGDTLVIIDRRGRTLAYHSLGEFMEDPCSSIKHVDSGAIELRAWQGQPLLLEMVASNNAHVELTARPR